MHWIFAQYFEASRKRERTGPHQVIKYIYWKLWQMLKKKKNGFGAGQRTNHQKCTHQKTKRNCSSFAINDRWVIGEDKAQHMANQAARQISFSPGIQGGCLIVSMCYKSAEIMGWVRGILNKTFLFLFLFYIIHVFLL